MHRTILGIEGTAWNLSAGVVTETEVLAEATATYQPKIGGIHPREAAQHHAAQIVSVIRQAMCELRSGSGTGAQGLWRN